MKRFTVAGITYTCKLLDIADNDTDVTSIRISSQGSQNMYIWRKGYNSPYALPNNTKVLSDIVILKAFKALNGSNVDVKYEPKRKDLTSSSTPTTPNTPNTPNTITAIVSSVPTSSISMYQVIDNMGNVSLFSNTNDVVKYSLNKTVTITEVFVNVTAKPTDVIVPIKDNIIIPTKNNVVTPVKEEILEDIEDVEDIKEEDCVKETVSKPRRVSRNSTTTGRGKGRAKKEKVLIPEDDELDE